MAVPMADHFYPPQFGCYTTRNAIPDDVVKANDFPEGSHEKDKLTSDFEFSTAAEMRSTSSDSSMLSADKLFSRGKILPLSISQESRFMDPSSLPEDLAGEENCLDGGEISHLSTVTSFFSSNVYVGSEMQFCPSSPKAPTCAGSFKDLIRSRKQQVHSVKDGQSSGIDETCLKTSKPRNPSRMLLKSCVRERFGSLSRSEVLLESGARADGCDILHHSSTSSLPRQSLHTHRIIQSSRKPSTRFETLQNHRFLVKSQSENLFVNQTLRSREPSVSGTSLLRTSVGGDEGSDNALPRACKGNPSMKSCTDRNVTACLNHEENPSASSKWVSSAGGNCPGKTSHGYALQNFGNPFSPKQTLGNPEPSSLQRSNSNPGAVWKKYEIVRNARPKEGRRGLERSTSYSGMRVSPVLNLPPIIFGHARKLGKGLNTNIISVFDQLFIPKKNSNKSVATGTYFTSKMEKL